MAIHTHGCKLNQSDSQELARQFEAAGYRVVDAPGAADVVVLNTCTVTATADAKARQFLRKVDRANPGAALVATGCYAQRNPEALSAIQGVSLVVNNTRKPELVDEVTALVGPKPRQAAPSIALGSPLGPTTPAKRGVKRTRAMIKIQEGCNQICAYCIDAQGARAGTQHPAGNHRRPNRGAMRRGLPGGGVDRHPTGLLRL